MVCNRTVVGAWEKFDWISNADGTISLRAYNSLYVSSENGERGMRCDRPAIGPWEKFSWGAVGYRTVPTATATTAPVAAVAPISFYPNPIVGSRVAYTLPEGTKQHTILVRDLYGHTVAAESFGAIGTHNTLSTATWKPGLYTIVIDTKTFRKTIKIQKQ